MWHTTLTKWGIKIILSQRFKKAFDKIQHLFIIKTLNKVSIEGTYTVTWYAHMTGPQITSYPSERLKAFLLRSEKRQDAHSVQYSTEVLAGLIKQEIKGIQTVKN